MEKSRQFVEEVPEIRPDAVPPPPPPTVETSRRPLGVLGLLPSMIMAGPVGSRLMATLAEVRPIKYFGITKHYFGPFLTGISGRLRVELTNRTPFTANCEFYNRSYAEGFKLVENTISFTLPRRSRVSIDYGWGIGILDLLVRAFLSLFSSETCCRGYVRIGGFKKDYDVTETVPVE